MSQQPAAFAQRSMQKIRFDNKDMDYYLAWLMGRQIYEGSDAGECLETAARIPEGDAEAWQREWRSLAEQIENQAQQAHNRNDLEGARRAFLRACSYYRAALFLMKPQTETFKDTRSKMQTCFRQAAALFDPPIQPLQFPYHGRQLAGYFWKPDRSDARRPTLLVIGGIETFAEDCYFMLGSSGAERGYNLITVDLPGQGVNPDQGLYLEARMDLPVKAAVSAVLSRPEVDPERLALFGFSWGGHIVFKGAQHDRRIGALIANPPMPDVFRSGLAQQKGHKKNDPIVRLVFDQVAWRMGLKISFNPVDIARRFAKAYDYLAHGRADARKILCPTLCLAGEGEAEITLRIARETIERLPHPKSKLVIFTKAEGGEAHCQVNNLALPNRVIFDWLEQVFADPTN